MLPVIKTAGLFNPDAATSGHSSSGHLPFKMRKSLESRLEETAGIRIKFPNKIPVIVERFKKELDLPTLDKTKFLVPEELTMSQFITIIRNRMSMHPSQTIFLLVNRKSMLSLSLTLAEVYEQEKDNDGFLYMVYCSQQAFGGDGGDEEDVKEVATTTTTTTTITTTTRRPTTKCVESLTKLCLDAANLRRVDAS